MKFPKGITKKQKFFLKEVYDEAYKKERDKEKAKKIARARFYEESFKIFIDKEKSQNKIKKIKFIKEDIDYKVYEVGSIKLYLSTDEKILNKKAERKGIIRDMNDEFEQEILFKVKEKYDISLHPDMYYLIK